MREIVIDVETTGLDPVSDGGKGERHRIVEIGAIEVVNLKPTGNIFHQYINPERSIPEDAVNIHNIDDVRVKDCPTFSDIALDFLDFIDEDAKLVAHNASFDMKFINAELAWSKRPPIEHHKVVDTLSLARKKFPGKKNTLDALCVRFGIDTKDREFHGALLDSRLLLDVYRELRLGGRQAHLGLIQNSKKTITLTGTKNRKKRLFINTEQEKQVHDNFLTHYIKNPIWKRDA